MIKNLLLWTILVIVSYPVSSTNILAKSWLIADSDGNVIESENIEIQQPIASITKLMTAMVVLDAHPNLTTTLDKKLRGLPVTRGQLINLAIIKSDNQAAKMLCGLIV
jgi:D-alanyl-D-alanine carboxypeptidase